MAEPIIEPNIEQDQAEGLARPMLQEQELPEGVTSIFDAPSLRAEDQDNEDEAVEAQKPKDFIDHQHGYSDADPTPAHGMELPRTDTISEADVFIGGARRNRQHGTHTQKQGMLSKLFGNSKLRAEAVNQRTEDTNGLNIGSKSHTTPKVAKPQHNLAPYPNEHPADFEVRKQRDFLNSGEVAEVKAYAQTKDQATRKSERANWSTESGPKVNK